MAHASLASEMRAIATSTTVFSSLLFMEFYNSIKGRTIAITLKGGSYDS